MRNLTIFALLLLAIAGFGCADPAKDKPQAEVAEPAPAPAEPTPTDAMKYVMVDPSSVGFVGSKVTGSHEGGFNEFTGEFMVNGMDPAQSSVNIEIDATSMWSDNDDLTTHLKSPDFFDVASFPTASFSSTQIEGGTGGYRVTGNLTLHGVTKSITFPAAISVNEERIRAQAEFAIKRFDFGIVYPGRKDDLIRDDVVIKLQIAAVPEGSEAAGAPAEEAPAEGA